MKQLVGLSLAPLLPELASNNELNQLLIDPTILQLLLLLVHMIDQRQVALLNVLPHQNYLLNDQLATLEHVQLYFLLLLSDFRRSCCDPGRL